MNSVFKNGSSLVMSEHPALSTYTSPPRGGKPCLQLGPGAQPHKHITRFTLHLKAQKPARRPSASAPWQGKEWEGPHGGCGSPWQGREWEGPHGRCGSWPRENTALSLPIFQGVGARGPGEAGEGEGVARHLVLHCCFVFPSPFSLPCYYPWLRDIVFVTKTLFSTLHNLEKGHLNGT